MPTNVNNDMDTINNDAICDHHRSDLETFAGYALLMHMAEIYVVLQKKKNFSNDGMGHGGNL